MLNEPTSCAEAIDAETLLLRTPEKEVYGTGNPATLGMLNGREYITIDIDEPHDLLPKLTHWVKQFARRQYRWRSA